MHELRPNKRALISKYDTLILGIWDEIFKLVGKRVTHFHGNMTTSRFYAACMQKLQKQKICFCLPLESSDFFFPRLNTRTSPNRLYRFRFFE